MKTLKRICVFAGSNLGNLPEYEKGTVRLGEELARRGIGLVYGGSKVGLMGRLANTVLEAGGEVIGVMPRGLFAGEMAHTRLTQFIEVNNMHERKAKMGELADAFIALPGGFGTFEELFEAVSWLQLGIHAKPVGLMNIEGFYDPLIQFVERSVEAGFVHPRHGGLLIAEKEPSRLVEQLMAFRRPEGVHKWTELPPV